MFDREVSLSMDLRCGWTLDESGRGADCKVPAEDDEDGTGKFCDGKTDF